MQVGRDDARLHDGKEILAIDLDDLVHPTQVDDYAAPRRHRAAAQPRPCSPGGNRKALLVRQTNDCRDLVCVRGPHHCLGPVLYVLGVVAVADQVLR